MEPQQRPNQPALQVLDVRCPKAHSLILQFLEQSNISAKHSIHRRLSSFALLDGMIQLKF